MAGNHPAEKRQAVQRLAVDPSLASHLMGGHSIYIGKYEIAIKES